MELMEAEFAYYFESQNTAISQGHLVGEHIDLIALGINNGWYDAIIQEIEFVDFSVNNTYYPLINASLGAQYKEALETTCLPTLYNCNETTGEVPECYQAHLACNSVDIPYGNYYPDIDYYDIRQPGSSPFPPETYVAYLQRPEIQKRIGAKVLYEECSDAVDLPFANYGDGK